MCMFVFYTCLCFGVFLLTSNFFYVTEPSDIESNEVWEPGSKKPDILRDMMTAIHRQKHYKQNQKSFNTSMLTHKEFVLMTGTSSAEEIQT